MSLIRQRTFERHGGSYAEAGRFDEASRTARSAHDRAVRAGDAPAARRIEERLALYDAGRPYREQP